MKPDIIFLLIPVALLVLLTMQNRKRRRELAAAQASLLLGAKVMTGAGMFATVVAVDGDQVTLETGPGQTSVWLRQAVVRVISNGPGLQDESAGADAPGEEHPVKD